MNKLAGMSISINSAEWKFIAEREYFKRKRHGKFRGATDTNNRFIYIDEKTPYEKKEEVLAHELGHVFLASSPERTKADDELYSRFFTDRNHKKLLKVARQIIWKKPEGGCSYPMNVVTMDGMMFYYSIASGTEGNDGEDSGSRRQKRYSGILKIHKRANAKGWMLKNEKRYGNDKGTSKTVSEQKARNNRNTVQLGTYGG